MANNEKGKNPKHFSGFWPTFIIIIVAAIAAMVIYLFANGNILQDQLDSISFWNHRMHTPVTKKTSEKTKATSTTTK